MKAGTAAVALLLLSPIVQLALAANPTPAAAYTAGSNATDLALAGAGTTLAAALGAPVQAPDPTAGLPGGPPGVVAGDLAILDAETGFAYNGSGNSATGPTGSAAPQGRSHVAVSRDGSTIVSLGIDAGGGLGTQPSQTKLYYQRVEPGTRWTPTTPATNISLFVGSNATDLLVSADGQRVVVALTDGDRYHVRAYRLSGGSLSTQFSFDQTGRVYDVDATGDLEHIVVAASLAEGNETHGALYHLSFAGTRVETLYERSYNGSALVSAAITPDLRLFAGDGRGRVLYAFHTTEFAALTLPGAAGNVTVRASADGKRMAAAVSGGQLALLDTSGLPAVRWNASLGEVRDFQLDATGSTLVAAINGTASGAFAFGDNSSTPFWKVDGAVSRVAINENGTLAAYARGGLVSALKVPRAITFEYPTGLKRGPVVTVKPQGTALIELQVNNTGAAAETVVFDGPKGLDLTLSTATPSLSVAPGEAKKVTFSATAGKSFLGSHTFNVSARAITSGAVDNVTVTLQLATVTNVTLVINGTKEFNVVPGQRSDLVLGVINNGSRDAAVGIRATQSPSQGGAWNVTIDPSSFTLAPNTITTVRVTIVPPEDAVNGTFNTVTLALEGPEVSDSSQVVFRINPTLSVEIGAAGRVKFVEPAKTAFYNVTVNNTGSLPRRFEAFFQATPTGGKNWAVDMDTAPFLLVPGGSKTIQVRVFAPVDATPSDRVSVFIIARSIPELANETVAQANLTLFANAVEPKPTTTTPSRVPIPAPGPVALVGALALLSFVLRPRRRDP